ncbi:aminoacyl-tRNA hydrolase [Lactobacillus sp. S2-2]|uniref:aminoacyl-tRNA hydrolase n=1 Tax=Lactobacillus sp. S2-2 TaxID=2692917 RepID=UPI001F001750|nr:aminoacyl-tRNA hydrolase [Lactobacillus sp. S2-2]MCF6515873.1 aminoacyl-tRNA hydrolase [Lactobacillus sp. S2-2]
MKMIVGLGNIGLEFMGTRHNTGFMTVEKFADRNNIKISKNKMHAKIGEGNINGEKVIVVQPTTMMNESGQAVRPIMDFYKIDIEDLIVAYDDMDLPVGKLRLRTNGSAGGHNGIKSLINHLGTKNFNRIRVGIDHPNKESVVNYVLGKFTKEQQIELSKGIDLANDALEEFVNNVEFSKLENKFN